MKPFALYRLPGETLATRITATKASVVSSCHDLNGRSGFVVAPFSPSPQSPILLIEPEEVTEFVPDADGGEPFAYTTTDDATAASRAVYASAFTDFHRRLTNGTFRKVVLARQKTVRCRTEVDAIRLFNRACALYPMQMIVLAHAQECGTWLMATPEIMLQARHQMWRTMALAGTMKACDEHQGWSVKNIREQRLVSSYISKCLAAHAHDIDLRGPMTAQAGALVHLKSEFTFKLHDEAKVGDLLADLYPTPAVCGIPKDATRRFIADHEPAPRSYYSGFMGPMNIHGDSDLYVSLRCMKIDGRACTLFAGGGLITDSVEEQEWLETEAKMGTMLQCFNYSINHNLPL